jgi:hypothetical protein
MGGPKKKLWWWKEDHHLLFGAFQCCHPWIAPKRGVGLMERGVHHKRIQLCLHQMVTMVQGACARTILCFHPFQCTICDVYCDI